MPPSSIRFFTVGSDVADSYLGHGHGASKRFAESRAELAELCRAGASYRSATRQHLGCLVDEGLSLVFGFHGRVGAVVCVGVCIRGWYVSYRRLVMGFLRPNPHLRPALSPPVGMKFDYHRSIVGLADGGCGEALGR